MKKRLLAMLLMVAVALTMAPAAFAADGSTDTLENTVTLEGEYDDEIEIKDGETVELTGKAYMLTVQGGGMLAVKNGAEVYCLKMEAGAMVELEAGTGIAYLQVPETGSYDLTVDPDCGLANVQLVPEEGDVIDTIMVTLNCDNGDAVTFGKEYAVDGTDSYEGVLVNDGTYAVRSNSTYQLVVEVTVNEGYEITDVYTSYYDSDEKMALTLDDNGMYVGEMPSENAFLQVVTQEADAATPDDGGSDSLFVDVPAGVWYADAVQYVVDKGMMNGVSETAFEPDSTTTRGMIVTMLYRLEGEPAAGTSSFTDVAADAWYADAVAWASANGVVNGASATSFEPDNAITREQMAAILYRYAQGKGYDVSVGEDTNILSYTDFDQLSEYAIPAMQWACGAGLITGDTTTTLVPQGNATRAQVATILMRFCENVA